MDQVDVSVRGFNLPCVAAFTLLPVLLFLYLFANRSRGLKLPPSPPAWPIIGHLHLLQRPLHQSLHKLSQAFGPFFFLRLGCMPTVVVSSPEWAKIFLQTHDRDFSDRPQFEASKRLFYGNKTVVTMKHGPQWRELRKMYTVQILTVKRIEMFEQARNREVAVALTQLIEKQTREGETVVEMGKFACNIIGNMMTGMLFSERSFGSPSSEGKFSKFKEMFLEMAVLFGAPILGDFISYLGWLDIPGYKKRMDVLAKQLDAFLKEVVSERLLQQNRSRNGNDMPSDFLDLLIKIYSTDEGLDTETIKSILLDLLSAGTETSTTTVEWAMAELLRNPSAMRKLQEELDSVVLHQSGSSNSTRMVEDEDLPKLSYLQAVLKETLRLHPPLPLVVRQMSRREGTEVGGYKLPWKTRLMVNVWAMGRDESIWEQAKEFKPERFEGTGLEVGGQHFELIPFGSGRRGCPGMNLGLAMVGLVLANLVHRFHWRLPEGETPLTLDMSEVPSRTAPKAKPLLAIAQLRV